MADDEQISGGAAGAFKRYSVGYENLNIKIEPAKPLSQACVLVGINIKLDPVTLHSLKHNSIRDIHGSDIDATIVAFCAYQNVYKEL